MGLHLEPNTPVNSDRLQFYLKGYDTHLSKYLVHGFKYGFKIHNMAFTPRDVDKNLRTATYMPHIVEKKIDKELTAGRIVGPFHHSPFSDFMISPLGLREKKVPGEYRVIHDLSYPQGQSVNSGIPREFATVSYSTVADAVKHILHFGWGCFLAKTDILSAFRIIPVHPDDVHLLGFKWNGMYYFDKCLPMGCSSSCSIFEAFSTSLEWIMSQRYPHIGIVHLLDDFLFVCSTYDKCLEVLDSFKELCLDIGVPLSEEKTFGPEQILPFAGIELNTVDMYARLPDDKLAKFIMHIDETLSSQSITKKKLDSVCGMLNYACSIIPSARAFTRRLYDIGIGVSKSFYKIKVTKQVQQDLMVWRLFLQQYNKQTFFLDYIWHNADKLHLYTDASTSIGYGGVFGTHWFAGVWEEECYGLNITLLELYPICLALSMWGETLSNKCIVLHTDNIAVVSIINNSTCKDTKIMALVRRLVLVCMSHNILVHAVHLPGSSNQISDSLSRQELNKALKLAPYLDKVMTPVPPKFHLSKWLQELKTY